MSVNYDFRCPKCGFTFEARVPSDQSRLAYCPECHATAERQPSAPAFTVQGGTPKFHK